MYFVASTLYFTAQNNDRKLGMPTTQASHKNDIWNVMYDIQINKTSESDEIFFSQECEEKQKTTSPSSMHVSTTRPQCKRLKSFESHHSTLICAIHSKNMEQTT